MFNTFYLLAVAKCQNGGGFFGLLPWYHYLADGNFYHDDANGHSMCDFKHFTFLPGSSNTSDIPLVLLAIVDDLLRIAAIVTLAFVMYGAFKYVASQGDPEGTAQAQKTVINSLIGVALAMTAVAIVSFMGTKFGGN